MRFGGKQSVKIVEIEFTEDSKRDYDSLPSKLHAECTELLKKLKRGGKKLGIPLENKNGKDLSGYYKFYFDEARYRIVYTAKGENIEIAGINGVLKEILEIIGIGQRDKEFIYKLIWERISAKDDKK